MTPELNSDDTKKMETVTALVEGLYYDHGGDHMAVIGYHDQITRDYGLTKEQWEDALRRAQQNIHEPAARAESEYRKEWAADPINAPVTTSKDWFQQEAGRIREATELAVPAAEVGLAAAYWNGRRESFNSACENVLANDPDRANDLPEAIQVDEIRIRQQVLEQQQDRSLQTAR